MNAINPAVLFLAGNEHQSAMSELESINQEIRQCFNKETLEAKVQLCKVRGCHSISGPVRLFIVMELEKAGWTNICFSVEEDVEYISMTANIAPEEIELYLGNSRQ